MKLKILLSVCIMMAFLFSQSGLMAQPSVRSGQSEDQTFPPDEMDTPAIDGDDGPVIVGPGYSLWGDIQNLRNLVERSDLVFRGIVSDIQYKLSEPTEPSQPSLPHTYVTFWVNKVLHGQAPSGHVTLQFIGGLDNRTMRYMAASIVPQFDLGDEDILFVQGNTQSLCPLVGNQSGRLRIINGQVYTENGREVKLSGAGRLEIGARHIFEETTTTTVTSDDSGVLILRKGFGPDVVVEGLSAAVTPEVITNRIEGLSKLIKAGGKAAGLFMNADPLAAISSGPDMTPAPPPQTTPGEDAKSVEPEKEETEEAEEIEPLIKSE